MKTGMQKCSFSDDATGTVVQLNDISEEGEIKIKEPLVSKDADGGERFAGHHSRIEITGFDDAGYDQLKTWEENKTPLKFVSYGIEGHILWYRETTITVKKNTYVPTGKNNSFTIVMEQKGGDHSGFDGNQIWYGKNLLYGAFGWEDTNGDGLPDRYQSSGAMDKTFANSKLSAVNTSGGDVTFLVIVPDLIYPLSGCLLNLVWNVASVPINKQYIIIKDYNTLTLFDQVDSTGILSHTTDANAYVITIGVIYHVVYSDGENCEVGIPSLIPNVESGSVEY